MGSGSLQSKSKVYWGTFSIAKIINESIWIPWLANELFESNFNVFSGFHPINSFLPKKISKSEARKKLNWDINVPIILFYGLIRSYKGLDNLLIAFSKPPISLSNAKLAIVGEFYEPIKKYKLLIKKLKLEEKIYIIPKL